MVCCREYIVKNGFSHDRAQLYRVALEDRTNSLCRRQRRRRRRLAVPPVVLHNVKGVQVARVGDLVDQQIALAQPHVIPAPLADTAGAAAVVDIVAVIEAVRAEAEPSRHGAHASGTLVDLHGREEQREDAPPRIVVVGDDVGRRVGYHTVARCWRRPLRAIECIGGGASSTSQARDGSARLQQRDAVARQPHGVLIGGQAHRARGLAARCPCSSARA